MRGAHTPSRHFFYECCQRNSKADQSFTSKVLLKHNASIFYSDMHTCVDRNILYIIRNIIYSDEHISISWWFFGDDRACDDRACDDRAGDDRAGDDRAGDARDLTDLLRETDFQQHVTEPTHADGNILDLVTTRNTHDCIVSAVSVDTLLTDHYPMSRSNRDGRE